jgi:hypothetical protein
MVRYMLRLCNFGLLYKSNNELYKRLRLILKKPVHKKDLRTILKILNYIHEKGHISKVQNDYIIKLQNV